MKQALFIITFLICTICCQEKNPLLRVEKTTIYSVTGDANSYQKDSIRFIEEEIYNHDDKVIRRNFYHPNGTLKAYEVFENIKGIPGSSYYDEGGQLLSYYQFEFNSNNQKTSSKAYDASNDELLRIEAYTYDSNGHRNKKEIRDASNTLQRSFIFSHDENGNENSLTLVDNEGNLLYREDYMITSKDSNNKWQELWGFIGAKANTCKTRETTFRSE